MNPGGKFPLLDACTERPLARECDGGFAEKMGGAREAFCEHCRRTVWNLSAMTRLEAEVRLLNAGSVPCIAFTRDTDGEVLFVPDPAPLRSHGSKRALAIVAAASLPLSACHHTPPDPTATPLSPLAPSNQAVAEALASERALTARDELTHMAGEPMPPSLNPAHSGTLKLVASKRVQLVRVARLEILAPAPQTILPTGHHVLELIEPNGRVLRTIAFEIKAGKETKIAIN